MARAKKKAAHVELSWYEKFRARPTDSARDSVYTTTIEAADEAAAAFEAAGRTALVEQSFGGAYTIPLERQNRP